MKTDLKHTDEPGKCWANSIKALAEDCDHEYYMSAMGPPSGTLERARRGRLRILEGIIELERMEQETSCLACHEEVQRQIKLQRDGLWKLQRPGTCLSDFLRVHCNRLRKTAPQYALFFFPVDRSHAQRVMLGTGQFPPIKI